MKFLSDLWKSLPFQVRMVGAAVLFGLILLLIILGRIGACRQRHEDQKIERQKEQITIDKVEGNVLSNQKTEIEGEVNNAANNSNIALGNFNNSVNRDSGSFKGDGTDRFCTRFPKDSTCAEWRRQRGLQ